MPHYNTSSLGLRSAQSLVQLIFVPPPVSSSFSFFLLVLSVSQQSLLLPLFPFCSSFICFSSPVSRFGFFCHFFLRVAPLLFPSSWLVALFPSVNFLILLFFSLGALFLAYLPSTGAWDSGLDVCTCFPPGGLLSAVLDLPSGVTRLIGCVFSSCPSRGIPYGTSAPRLVAPP